MRGKNFFVAIEGADAAGKATQTKLLADVLGARAFSSPDYSTSTGQLLHRHLHGEWEVADRVPPSDTAEQCHGCHQSMRPMPRENMLVRQSLMIANRLEQQDAIVKALDIGPVVVDRWHMSSVIYGEAEGAPVPPLLTTLHPDLYILLDTDYETAIARRPPRDLNERDEAKQRKVMRGYRHYWHRMSVQARRIKIDEPWWAVIDGRRTVEQVHRDIGGVVQGARLHFGK